MSPRAWVVSNHVPGDPSKPVCITLFQLHDNEASARQAAAVLGFKAMAWVRPGQWCVAGETMLDESCSDPKAAVDAFLDHLSICKVDWRWSQDLMPEFEGESPLQNIYASLDDLRQALD